jgi:hypothetical protein
VTRHEPRAERRSVLAAIVAGVLASPFAYWLPALAVRGAGSEAPAGLSLALNVVQPALVVLLFATLRGAFSLRGRAGALALSMPFGIVAAAPFATWAMSDADAFHPRFFSPVLWVGVPFYCANLFSFPLTIVALAGAAAFDRDRATDRRRPEKTPGEIILRE